MSLSAKDKKQLARQRREAARQAQKYHREQDKRAKKSSDKKKKEPAKKQTSRKRPVSKIEEAVNSGNTAKFEKISREEKFRREGRERIKNLKPRDFEDGYYIDEYREKKRQEKRAQVIRKQEKEVIRRNKKPLTSKQVRNRRIMLSAAIFLIVLAVGIILSLTVLFKTEKIDIEGDSYYYDDQIIAFSNVSLQQNIFLAAMGATPQEIIDNLPYVENAEIGFSIPDTVTIKITDAKPSYVIKDGNNFLLISSKGRILESVSENKDQLTELICGDYSGNEVGQYIEFSDPAIPEILESVAESLKNNGFENIVGFDVTDTSAITLNYANRIQINIGIAEDIDYKIKTAYAIITKKLDPNNTGQVYGTLDVSTCSKNKMSHYKPGETQPVSTLPAATEPTTEDSDIPIDYSYNDTYDDSNNYSYDDTYDYFSGGNSYYDDNDYGSYGDGSYDNSGDDSYNWLPDVAVDNGYQDYGGYEDNYYGDAAQY